MSAKIQTSSALGAQVRGATVLGIAALLSACAHTATAPPSTSTTSNTFSPAPGPTTTAPTTTPARTETWTALQPGDCLAEPPPTDPAVVQVTVVDCAGPHLAETFARVGIPVDAALSGTASSQCEAGFVTYTGRTSAGSGYTISYLIDSDQDRTSNNPLPSTVICLLQSAAGTALNGSART